MQEKNAACTRKKNRTSLLTIKIYYEENKTKNNILSLS